MTFKKPVKVKFWRVGTCVRCFSSISRHRGATGASLTARCKNPPLAVIAFPPEPQSVFDLLREDPRPPLLHGGAVSGGHEDLDGCHSNRRRGLHAVHELRDHWVTLLECDTDTPACPPAVPPAEGRALQPRLTPRTGWI